MKFVGFKPRRVADNWEPINIDDEEDGEKIRTQKHIRWRKRNRSLQTKPIYTEQFPKLLGAMASDGLHCIIHEEGYQWFHGNYAITAKTVRDVWSLSDRQYRRLMRYVYIHGTQW